MSSKRKDNVKHRAGRVNPTVTKFACEVEPRQLVVLEDRFWVVEQRRSLPENWVQIRLRRFGTTRRKVVRLTASWPLAVVQEGGGEGDG
jgi:hypothetical protein